MNIDEIIEYKDKTEDIKESYETENRVIKMAFMQYIKETEGTYAVVLSDIDGDEDLDLITGNFSSNNTNKLCRNTAYSTIHYALTQRILH